MPSMEGGGVEKNLILIANYFAQNHINIKLITYKNKFSNLLNSKIKIITPNKKSINKSKYYKYFVCLFILLNTFLRHDSVIFSFQANIYAIILCKLFNKKIIVRSNSSPSGWNKNLLKNFIFKIFLKKSDVLIVNSKIFKKEMDNKFNTNSKFIPNPLNKNEIILKSKKTVKVNVFKKNCLNIINIARFTDQKDHFTLLKAFKKIHKKIKIRLLIIGYGPNKKKIINFILSNNLSKKVVVKSFKKNPYPYIKKSDLFVLSSKYEGLPNVLLEAIALKKYVISSNCPTGPKEILGGGKYGTLFKISNYNQLAKHIIDFSKNKKTYKKKIYFAYKSLKRYDFNENCRKYMDLTKKFI